MQNKASKFSSLLFQLPSQSKSEKCKLFRQHSIFLRKVLSSILYEPQGSLFYTYAVLTPVGIFDVSSRIREVRNFLSARAPLGCLEISKSRILSL